MTGLIDQDHMMAGAIAVCVRVAAVAQTQVTGELVRCLIRRTISQSVKPEPAHVALSRDGQGRQT